MFSRILLILAITQLLFTSTWASAHMAAETHSCIGSPHIELSFSASDSDHSTHHNDVDLTDSEEHQHGEHIHLCFCALGQIDLRFQVPLTDRPFDSFYQTLSLNLGPDTPPPTV